MNRIERRVRAAVNPASTAFAGWWCHSNIRHLLTGHGSAPSQGRLIRTGRRAAAFTPSAEQMKARAEAIDELLSQSDHEVS
jgi:hypothetical protein